MKHLKQAGILLLLAASTPAAAEGQGGGAGGADPSGATEATSGRERRSEASEGQPAAKEEVPQRREGRTPGVSPDGVRHRRQPGGQAEGSSGTGEKAPSEDEPTTTGGGI